MIVCASCLPRGGLNLSQSRSCFHGKWAKCTECGGPTNKIITKNDNAKIIKKLCIRIGKHIRHHSVKFHFYRRYESFVRVTNLLGICSSATFGATVPGENKGGDAYVVFSMAGLLLNKHLKTNICSVL